LTRIDSEARDIIIVEGVPSESKERLSVGSFVEDGGMI
jgi:hypothetical protein